MSKGVNKVILIGNLGQEPTISTTTNGVLIANISLAVSESRKDPNTGNYINKVEWVRCVLFNNLAKIVQDWLHKGSSVYVEGKLQTRQYVDKNNVQRSVTEVVVSELTMLGSNAARYGNNPQEFNGNANMGYSNGNFGNNNFSGEADPYMPQNNPRNSRPFNNTAVGYEDMNSVPGFSAVQGNSNQPGGFQRQNQSYGGVHQPNASGFGSTQNNNSLNNSGFNPSVEPFAGNNGSNFAGGPEFGTKNSANQSADFASSAKTIDAPDGSMEDDDDIPF